MFTSKRSKKLMTSIMLASTLMGLATVVPSLTSSNVTVAHASSTKITQVKVKHSMNEDTQIAINGWLHDRLSDKVASAIMTKMDVAYSNTYDKTKDNKKSMTAAYAVMTKYTGIKFSYTGDYSDGAKVDKAKASMALKNAATPAQVSSSVSSIVNTASKKKTTPKKKTSKKKATKKYAYKISKLTSKKTKSNKYVKVNGKVKVSTKALAKKHHAKWARITTYKGYKFVRLNKHNNFKATIKAPKAKKTWAKVGYYTKNMKHGKVVKKHGKVTYTFHLLSAHKKVSVKAYK